MNAVTLSYYESAEKKVRGGRPTTEDRREVLTTDRDFAQAGFTVQP